MDGLQERSAAAEVEGDFLVHREERIVRSGAKFVHDAPESRNHCLRSRFCSDTDLSTHFSAATVLPIQAKHNKIRSIVVVSVLRRLVTKALLPSAIDDSRDFLAPFQMANDVKAGIDVMSMTPARSFAVPLRRLTLPPTSSTSTTPLMKSIGSRC